MVLIIFAFIFGISKDEDMYILKTPDLSEKMDH